MGTAEGLMNLGQPAELAKRTGVSIVSVTTGAAPVQLKGPGNLSVLVTVTVAAQDVLLPDNADIGDVVEIYNVDTTDSLDILPHVGGSINGGAPNAPFARTASATTANAGVCFRKISATHWRTISA